MSDNPNMEPPIRWRDTNGNPVDPPIGIDPGWWTGPTPDWFQVELRQDGTATVTPKYDPTEGPS